MREQIRDSVTSRALLNGVVSDGGCGLESLLDVTGF